MTQNTRTIRIIGTGLYGYKQLKYLSTLDLDNVELDLVCAINEENRNKYHYFSYDNIPNSIIKKKTISELTHNFDDNPYLDYPIYGQFDHINEPIDEIVIIICDTTELCSLEISNYFIVKYSKYNSSPVMYIPKVPKEMVYDEHGFGEPIENLNIAPSDLDTIYLKYKRSRSLADITFPLNSYSNQPFNNPRLNSNIYNRIASITTTIINSNKNHGYNHINNLDIYNILKGTSKVNHSEWSGSISEFKRRDIAHIYQYHIMNLRLSNYAHRMFYSIKHSSDVLLKQLDELIYVTKFRLCNKTIEITKTEKDPTLPKNHISISLFTA